MERIKQQTTADKIKTRLDSIAKKQRAVKRIPVSSSMIKEIERIPGGGLVVVFNTGKAYKYPALPKNVTNDLLKADSIGRFFNENVKNKYEHEKVAELQRKLSDRTN